MKKGVIYLLFLLSGFSMAALDQQSMKVDIRESKIKWTGKQTSFEHKGYVKLTGGELIVEKNEVKGGSFTIDMTSITDADNKEQGGNSKLESQLRSAEFFNVGKYPEARFVITKVTKQPVNANTEMKTTHRIEGDLTIKGITRKVSFNASINLLHGRFAASTPPFTITKTEWAVNNQHKSESGAFIYDNLILEIDLVSM